MSKKPSVPTTVDEYIDQFPAEIQARLVRVRAAVRKAAPQATEVISYRMPALKQHGILVYYAAFKEHIGFYPPIRGDADLEAEAAPYANEKGNLRFPHSERLPIKLITALTRLRAKQDQAKATAKRGR